MRQRQWPPAQAAPAPAVGSVGDGDDDVRRLDDRGDLAARVELQLVGRLDGDRRYEPDAARVQLDVGGRFPGGDGGHRGRDLIACAQLHGTLPVTVDGQRSCGHTLLRLATPLGDQSVTLKANVSCAAQSVFAWRHAHRWNIRY